MKRTRWLAVVIVVALIAIGVLWFIPRSTTFATPGDCIQAFYAAAKDSDANAYRLCLSESLRLEIDKRYPKNAQLQSYLKASMENIMNWVQIGAPAVEGGSATLTMEETRKQTDQQIRIRYRLKKTSAGWRIAAMEAPKNVPTVLPYGIHEKDVWKKSND